MERADSKPNFVSERVQRLPAPGIRRFFDLLGSLHDVISLGVGEPDLVTPWHIRDAAIRALEQGHTHYTSNYGLPELRKALAEHLDRRYGLRYDPAAELLITSGVSEGLQLALSAVLDPADEVLCPDPAYVAYQPCTVLAWGNDVAGEIGNGTDSDSDSKFPLPVAVKTVASAKGLAASSNTNYAYSSSMAWAWGGDTFGTLGNDAAVSDKQAPVKVKSVP